MLPNTNQNSSQSQLARLLASENIIVRHDASVKTASFDLQSRVLRLPVWQNMSQDLYDMLVIHEVGHAIDTPLEGTVERIKALAAKLSTPKVTVPYHVVFSFMNVIEDVRIDKRQKRRYPGSKVNYTKGYKELLQRDFFELSKRPLHKMMFLDRVNVYFKGGMTEFNIKFSDEEKVLLAKIGATETFDEVMALVEETFHFCRKALRLPKKLSIPVLPRSQTVQDDLFSTEDGEKVDLDEDEDEDAEVEADDDSESEDDSKDDSEDEEDDVEESGFLDDADNESEWDKDVANAPRDMAPADDYQDSPTDEEAEPEKIEPEDLEEGSKVGVTGDEFDPNEEEEEEPREIPEVETYSLWNEGTASLIENGGNSQYCYVGIPKFPETVIHDYKRVLKEVTAWRTTGYPKDSETYLRNRLTEFVKQESQTITFMVKEFEMKKAATAYAKIRTDKTGVIDTNKLHSYQFNEDIFRKSDTIPAGQNHGFVMFIDWSGSMNRTLLATVKQLLTQVLFCRRTRMPFEVYSFLSASGDLQHGPDDIQFSNFKLRNLLSSRMTPAEFNEGLINLWTLAHIQNCPTDCMSSTPLNQAIIQAIEIVNNFRKRNKIEVCNTVFLTDGGGDSGYTPDSISKTRDHSKRLHIFVQDLVSKKTYDMPNMYGFGGAAMTRILLKILKDRTGSNVIGFYLFEGKFRSLVNEVMRSNVGGHTLEYEAIRQKWKDDGFVATKEQGYDTYYLLRTDRLDVVKPVLKVTPNMTKKQALKEFTRFNNSKSINRILLKAFTDQISKNA